MSETGGTRRRARVSHQACEPSPSAPAPWKEKTPDTHPSHPARACSGVLYYCAAKKTIRTMDEARKDYLHHAGRSPGPPALRTSNHGQRTLRSPTGTVTTALSTHCCCHCLQLPATACHCLPLPLLPSMDQLDAARGEGKPSPAQPVSHWIRALVGQLNFLCQAVTGSGHDTRIPRPQVSTRRLSRARCSGQGAPSERWRGQREA